MIIYLIYAILIAIAVKLNPISPNSKKQAVNLWLTYGLPSLIMVIFSFLVSASNFCGDFNKSYYPAGRLIWENPASLYEWEKGLGFVNLPIFAILFTPISFLPKLAAQIIITLLGVLSIFWSTKLLLQLTKASGWQKLAIPGLILINGPLYYSLKQGNSTHFVLLLLIAALFCIRDKREIWVGILLAIAALIKLPLFLLGVYFACRQRWRVLLGFTATIFAIVFTSILLFGIDLHLIWLEKCVFSFAGKPLASFNVQSVDGFVGRLLYDVEINNWQPLEIDWKFKLLRYLIISIIVGSSILICWRAKPPVTLEAEYLELAIALCIAILISPISWTHYYLYLLLPLSLYFCNLIAIPQTKNWRYAMAISGIFLSLPVIIINSNLPLTKLLLSKIFISHYFFGGLLLLAILLAAKSHTSNTLSYLTNDQQPMTNDQ